ncbi:MAG TPA: efflux RND transporter periplasmic adaptor subunit [Pyrinomonadaceae bacterium]|nr:efflux RND transporter periplasmic adaptor subunit [Pyrinomonadaceae bacterium]
MAVSRKKKIIIAVAAVAVITLVVIISVFAGRKDEPEVTVVKVQVRPELRSTVTASGEVRPIKFINLTSEVNGRIEEIFVNPGDAVTQGQPLVRLDPTQLQSSQEAQTAGVQVAISDVQNARASVTAAENSVSQARQGLTVAEAGLSQARQGVVTSQTSVDRAQVDLNTAQRELRRQTELVEAGVASRAEYDAARDRLEQAQVALRTAQAQLQQQRIAVEESRARVNQQKVAVRDAQIGVERARTGVASSEARVNQQQAILRGQSSQRSKATQLSPLTGVVADIPARQGQFALANLTSTALMTIADMSTINVEVNVDETEIGSVEVGQQAKVKISSLGEREVEGVVMQKNPLAVGKSDASGGGLQTRVNVQEAKEFKVVIELRNMPDDVRSALRPGMTADATITTKTKQNVLAVPLQAVIEKPAPTPSPGAAGASPAPAAPGEKPKEIKGVYVLEGNKVKFLQVETGITGESDIEIVSGLTEGLEVITGPSRVLRTLKENATAKKQTRKPGEGEGKAGESK